MAATFNLKAASSLAGFMFLQWPHQGAYNITRMEGFA
jgi:hypothetical protein